MSQKNTANGRTIRRTSLRTTLFGQVLTLLTLTVVAVSATAFALSWNELKQRTVSQLQSIAQAKEVLMETTLSRQREQLAILAREPELRSLSSLTGLVGFRQLVKFDATGTSETIAGTDGAMSLGPAQIDALRKSDGTVLTAVVTEDDWTLYAIATPVTQSGARVGTLVAIFDPTALASRILHADYIGSTAEVLLVAKQNGKELVLRADERSGAVPIRGENGMTSVIDPALRGEEGVAETTDYAGIPVLAAYRSVPSLGWGIMVKIDRYEVRAPIERLAMNLLGAGLMTVIFLSLSIFLLARRIIGPLEKLTHKLDDLETKHWIFERSIFNGNELEVVDEAAADLAQRLRKAHDHLESAVHNRTKELRVKNAKDDAILESMDDGLLVTDAEGRVTYVNRMAELLTGLTDVVGKVATDTVSLFDKTGALVPKNEHPVSIVLKKKSRFDPASDPEFTLKHVDGTETALQIRATPILRGQQLLGVVVILRDISEERKIDHMKSEFISLVSHQLRTPLSSIRWYLEMLLTDESSALTPDQRSYAQQAAESNARMVHLINALLNVSRIEMGKFKMSPEAIDLQQLVQAIKTSFSLEMQQRDVTIDMKIPAENCSVRSDRGLVELILENLLSNAIKYSKTGTSVKVTMEADASRGDIVCVISDTGIGIPALEQQQIGKKLFRGTNAKTSDTTGNGLGLYISMIAAESIGAEISFESEQNTGTSFTVRIPKEPKTKA